MFITAASPTDLLLKPVFAKVTKMHQSNGARLITLGLWLLCSLEIRATVFTVTTTNDSGAGSLRQAIIDAELTVAKDSIQFQIPGAPPFTISPLATLPAITHPLVIDGTTQPQFSGQPIIELNGASAGSGVNGLLILAGDSRMRGLSINRFNGDGIRIEGNGTNLIDGNWIGVGLSGNSDSGNGRGGITIFQSHDNVIGGSDPGFGNVISGQNLGGIYIIDHASRGNEVLGNFIGTDVTGAIDRGNINDGILVSEAPGNTIGGYTTAARNVISGNNQSGIYLSGLGATQNVVVGNFIGTDFQGIAALSNSADGVTIYRGSLNQVGATTPAGRNLVSGNGARGIFINGAGATANTVLGNFIGTTVSGTARLANNFSGVGVSGCSSNLIGGTSTSARNIISGNNQSGIAIDGTNATANSVQGNFVGTDVTGTVVLGNFFNGVSIIGSPNNVIGGTGSGAGNVISGNSQRGIYIGDIQATGNKVQGNLIGTDSAGQFDRGNAFAGVWIESPGNVVGGSNAITRNVISGNDQSGVYLIGAAATNNVVQGNFIGTDRNGTAALSNSFGGINLTNAPSNLIGGSAPGEGNLISGNSKRGIYFEGLNARSNRVEGNYIGTDISGTLAIPNSGGIWFYGSPENTIGGTIPGMGNLISGNLNVAVSIGDPGANANVVRGNSIGVNADGATLANQWHGIEILNTSSNNVVGGVSPGAGNVIANAQTLLYAGVRVRDGCIRNSIRGNSIYRNNGLGIDLSTNGVTANHVGGSGSATNYLQNYPFITSVTGRYITTIQGTLTSLVSQSFTVDLYSSLVPDPSGYGEGQFWLGATTVTTSGSGSGTFSVKFTNAVPTDRFITATATDTFGNSSEFSAVVAIATNTPAVDSDLDGMPDEFEIATGLNPNNNADAALDSDGDGATNLQEYQSGTNPLDPSSAFRLLPLITTSAGVQLLLPTEAERSYGIQFSTDLVTWPYLPNATNVAGDKTIVRITDPGATNAVKRFYRARLLP